MKYKVVLTPSALQDIKSLYGYIRHHDTPEKAEFVLNQISDAINNLADFPKRGACPKELSHLGIQKYREVFFKPYRIIYKISEKQVIIILIADGRRDMQTLLTKRLLK